VTEKSPAHGAVILLYHRVAELPTDPQLLAVSPEHFCLHMEHLRQAYQPMRLTELLTADPIPAGAVAVTFDDGYADNLENAEPILRQLEIPATVFIAGHVKENQGEFFWDELDRILLRPGTLPRSLVFDVVRRSVEVDLGPDAVVTPQSWQRHRRWNVLQTEDPTVRHRLYRELCGLLYGVTVRERSAALHKLRAWAGVDDKCRESHRRLSPAQIRHLAQSKLIDIGGHTLNHALLSAERLPDQQAEILENTNRLEDLTGAPVQSFSYPFGTRDAYTPQSMEFVKAAGFACACANYPRRAGPETDRYRLPRFVVRDWPLDEFKRRLREYFASPLANEGGLVRT